MWPGVPAIGIVYLLSVCRLLQQPSHATARADVDRDSKRGSTLFWVEARLFKQGFCTCRCDAVLCGLLTHFAFLDLIDCAG